METRKRTFKQLDLPVTLTVKTKCPDKWILVDTEMQRTFVGNQSGTWIELGVKDE